MAISASFQAENGISIAIFAYIFIFFKKKKENTID
jgi:hypothetical protein